MSSIRKLVGDTVIYGFSSMLGRFLNYLLVPLHTSLFLPEQLAVQIQLYVYAAVAYALFPLGLETAYFRFAVKEEDQKKYFNIILSAVILMSLFCAIPIFVFSEQIAAFIQYPKSGLLIKMFAFITAFQAISTIPLAKLRLEGNGKRFARIVVFNILICVLLNLFFLIFCRDVNAGKYLSVLKPLIDLFYFPEYAPNYIIVAHLITTISGLILLRSEFADFHFVFSFEIFRPIWIYASPILIVNVAMVSSTIYDRAVMQFLLPPHFYPGRSIKEVIGIYGICSQLSGFMNLCIQGFKYAAEPFFFSKGKDENAPESFARIMKYFIITCSIIWIAVSINLDVIAALFLKNKIYHEGLAIVPWQLAGFLFLGIYYNLATWFKLTDRTEYGTYLTVIGAVITISVSYLLVARIGYLGFAIAFAVSSFVMMVLCYFLGQKYYPVPYNLPSGVGYIAFAAFVIFVCDLFHFHSLAISFLIHAVVVVAVLGITILLEKKMFNFSLQ